MQVPLFVKVSPFVAKKMALDGTRFRTADGNFLLRQSDFSVFGPISRLESYAAAVGGVVLRDSEAAANQRGTVNTPLPVPEDPDWIAPAEDADTDADAQPMDQDTEPEEGGHDE
ncbi:MAG: hypothetical protein K2M06_02650 [Muribaculaceae bacterium]|nr:hypothetical protein [Muribaculaceae bacterium]